MLPMTDCNTTPQALNEKLYDLCMVEKLCRGNQEQVKKMVSVFIDQIPGQVNEIKSAYQQGDLQTVKRVAHRLYPTLSYYAVVTVERDVKQIEAMADGQVQGSELEAKISKLDNVIAKTVDQMRTTFFC